MSASRLTRSLNILCLGAIVGAACPARGATTALLGWNNLGMHCMDSDYSVFSILPPYNTIEAQLVVGGALVRNGAGYSITYQAVADPDGSFNSTAMGKGNFYTYATQLYGAALAPEMGLAGWAMPGTNNTPQGMRFEVNNQPAPGVSTPVNWFRAEGIPISPYDDAHVKNPYPLMRLVARDAANNVIATSAIVLPVSDEMDCRACHGSGTQAAAQPAAGWASDPDPEREYRLNILRLHDEREFGLHRALYSAALAARGFNPSGLYTNVVTDGKPVLCATCHASEALGTASYGTIPPLTASVHSHHATVVDPTSHLTLDSALNRSACYRCHPGSTTRCLRGAMGSAIAADGSMAMQCQSCHGNMSTVGSANRVGWFMEPNCQSCHTGSATRNNGQIRYTSAFVSAGVARAAVDQTFATTPNTPAAGLSLYRFSVGHGGLQCSACHGSTHAEFPSSHRNDNLRNVQLQGHVGVLAECTTCHPSVPNTTTGGPHGMHPVGQTWVNRHHNLFEGGGASRAQCQVCHGLDYRGTVLSRALADRQLVGGSEEGTATVQFFRGAEVGCYNCHNGPNSEDMNNKAAPTVRNVAAITPVGQPVAVTLPAGGANLTLRIVSQPAHGSVGLNGTIATYFPEPGYNGLDTFTFAAYDGAKNSTLGTGTIAVGSATLPPVDPSAGLSVMVLITGQGTVSPDLNGKSLQAGKKYTLKAKPGKGYAFASWTGSLEASTPAITFVAQTNMVLQANFVPDPALAMKGTYYGLFYESNGVSLHSAGAFTLTVAKSGAFSARLQTAGARQSVSGKFGATGEGRVSATRRGMGSLAVALHLDLTNGTGRVWGTVSDGTWTANLSGNRAGLGARTGTAPQTTRYTLLIPGQLASDTGPGGDGCAILSVSRTGRLILGVSLADGTKSSQSSAVANDGQAPLFLGLYRGRGLVIGWLTFTNLPNDDLTGDLFWTKESGAGGLYPNGFALATTAAGSRYVKPTRGVGVLNLPTGTLALTGAGFTPGSTNQVTLDSKNRIASSGSNELTMKLNPSSGAFSGSLRQPGAAKPITFGGAVHQKRNLGAGWFLNNNESGHVDWGP